MVPPGETTEVEAVWVSARSAWAATGAGVSNMQVDAARANTPNESELRTRSETAARIRCITRRTLARQKLKRESCAVCLPLASSSEKLRRPKMSFECASWFVQPASPRVSIRSSLARTFTTRCALNCWPSRVSNIFPRCTAAEVTGVMVTISSSFKLGVMLAPSARNRTGRPWRRNFSASSPNRRESRRVSFSELFTEQSLHGSKIRHKRKFEAGHLAGDLAEKLQNKRHRLGRMMRHETARV